MPHRRQCIAFALVALATTAFSQELPFKPQRVQPYETDALEQHLDVVYAKYGERELHLDLFRLKSQHGAQPAVVVVHGGGWLQGDKTRFRAMAQSLALRGYVAAAIEYRLGGEAKFPAAIHDCNAAVRFLRANAEKYGIDPQRIGAVGGSAGGHLVGLMAAAPNIESLQGDGGSNDQSSKLQAAVVLAGPFELATGPVAERSRKDPKNSNSNRWLGKTVDEAPDLYRLASPFTHLSNETPPILFMHGELDRPEQNLGTREKLRASKVDTGVLVYKYGKHGCWNQHPWFDAMMDDADAFLAGVLKPAAAPAVLLEKTDWGEIRRSRSGLELYVAQRPDNGAVTIPRFNNPITVCYLQGDGAEKPLNLKPGVKDWSIQLPKSGDAPLVVVVETVGDPWLPAFPRVTSAAADGTVTLAAHDAVTHGKNLRYEPQPHKNTVGYWTQPDDWCEWNFYVDRPGKYAVHILQGCGKGQGGSTVRANIGDQQLEFTVEDTGHFQNFKDRTLGEVSLAGGGLYTLTLKPQQKAKAAVMDVRQVRLVLVGD